MSIVRQTESCYNIPTAKNVSCQGRFRQKETGSNDSKEAGEDDPMRNRRRRETKRRGIIDRVGTLMTVVGILCSLYCLSVPLVGFGTRFFLIWGVLGAGLILTAFLLCRKRLWARLPKWLRRLCLIVLGIGMLLFVTVEGVILSQFFAKPSQPADIMIVLGAQWRTTGPSRVLRQRLDTAADYLKRNPDVTVIVSGGQGSNEPIAEAEGMRDYLCDAGVDGSRILVENRSTSTEENLRFSADLFDVKSSRVVLVTNNYHVYRACGIAKKQGYQVEGLAAGSDLWMVPNNLLREFLAVIKDFLCGNMAL